MQHSYDRLFGRRPGQPTPKLVPLEIVEEVLWLCQERYHDFNVRHFHEKLVEEHGITLSYTSVKLALQRAGLVKGARQRGGRSERRFGAWQERLPQEQRLAGTRKVEEANRFLRESYIKEISRRFCKPAADCGHAFVPVRGRDLDRTISVRQKRRVADDNTVR